jgi:hypothetical protein
MGALQGILTSPKVNRYLPWVSGLILLAGVIAFLIAYFGNTASSTNSKVSNQPAQTEESIGKAIPVPKSARSVAARFIDAGVRRKSATVAWQLSGPELRAGYKSLAQWKRDWNDPNEGVPIVPYPAAPNASVSVDYSNEKEIQLKFGLKPRPRSTQKPQTFLMVLDKIDGRWVVNTWQSYSPPPIPAA